MTAEEGKRLKTEAVLLERDPSLAREAKGRNRARNGGRLVCEGCAFANDEASLFDAHHLVPLVVGTR